MVDCQKHRQGLGCAGRITVILVRVKVVEAGGGGVGEGRRGVSTGGFGRERGGREREEARSLQTEEGKNSVTVNYYRQEARSRPRLMVYMLY